jgi:prenyltransferase beta subunit
VLARLEGFRKPDGGYEGDPKVAHGTAYGAFVALGAYEDLNAMPPAPLKLIQSLKSLETPDGAWSNVPGAKIGATLATTGAVTLIRHLGFPVNDQVGDWLLARAHPQGGFLAAPHAPMPDLLSTATVLHALAAMERRLPSKVHERCLDFLDTLWSAEGGFHGHWADEHLDAEYTFYGLLALGHLSL